MQYHTWTDFHDDGVGAIVIDICHLSRLIASPERIGDAISPQGKPCAGGVLTQAVQHRRGRDATGDLNVLVLLHASELKSHYVFVFQRITRTERQHQHMTGCNRHFKW